MKRLLNVRTWFFLKMFVIGICVLFQACAVRHTLRWPETTRETKPWTRWWWHGSALTREGITTEMEAYKKAGIGGLEITPIYGVRGYENQFVPYLSAQWVDLLIHTLKEAERLDMGIDMATGTGWPFGGPWVKEEDACRNFRYRIYDVTGGTRLPEKIEFIQQPYVRAVANQVYEVHSSFSTAAVPSIESPKESVVRLDPNTIDISQLKQPISANKNLQALALDQVQFERPLALKVLMGYSDKGEVLDLTNKVDANGNLDWVAPAGNWKVYAVFEGWHGKMVERAGPGGEGDVIDHFSAVALKNYLARFDSAFAGKDIQSLRAFFNDSYEVDDAKDAADWTPALFDEFRKRRGYDLRQHLPALFGQDNPEKNRRVLCDYRETISELLLHNFTLPWREWSHGKSAIVRNQAHGSPSNILDLYAAVDIPEIEGVEPLRIKMASSAGNVTGKKLVSSESATWLNEHFESNLGDIKTALDRFMLHGVNHLFYHGTSYSPPAEPWPGWLFYAAVHLNPRNSLWNDFDALNQYASRCQSFLQDTKPDNDVLLYYPIYDRFSTPGKEMVEHFDGVKQFENTAFVEAAATMLKRGYAFDYISDQQISRIVLENGKLKTEGNSFYGTLVIPQCEFISLTTLEKIVSLAQQGAAIIFLEGLPSSVAGYGDLESKKKTFGQWIEKINKGTIGKGKILKGDNLEEILQHASIRRETMVDKGISYIRKRTDDGQTVYFIANTNDRSFEGWLPLETSAGTVALFDPMNGQSGSAILRKSDGGSVAVSLQLTPGQTLILETFDGKIEGAPFPVWKTFGEPVTLSGKWKVTFLSGGPELPPAVETNSVSSWTLFSGSAYQSFSGTASYTVSFDRPQQAAAGWLLDLGNVKESAEISLNGKLLGTLIGPVYQIHIDASLLKEKDNVLEVKVSNLMANRISDLDRRNVFWRKFYNVNFPARKAENRKNGLFDASNWLPKESGLLGPVKLVPIQHAK